MDIAFSAFKWNEVISGIERVKKLNITDNGKYQLMLGIAYFELNKIQEAQESFTNASNSEKYADSGVAWLEYLQALKG